VFGASGRTGKMVVEQALEKGYRVTAIVRNPEKLPIRHTDLEIVRGDVLQILSFENLIHKNATIISCLGVQNRNPTFRQWKKRAPEESFVFPQSRSLCHLKARL